MQFTDWVKTFYVSPSKLIYFVVSQGAGFKHADKFSVEQVFVFNQL